MILLVSSSYYFCFRFEFVTHSSKKIPNYLPFPVCLSALSVSVFVLLFDVTLIILEIHLDMLTFRSLGRGDGTLINTILKSLLDKDAMKRIHGAVDAKGRCAARSRCGKNLREKGEIQKR